MVTFPAFWGGVIATLACEFAVLLAYSIVYAFRQK